MSNGGLTISGMQTLLARGFGAVSAAPDLGAGVSVVPLATIPDADGTGWALPERWISWRDEAGRGLPVSAAGFCWDDGLGDPIGSRIVTAMSNRRVIEFDPVSLTEGESIEIQGLGLMDRGMTRLLASFIPPNMPVTLAVGQVLSVPVGAVKVGMSSVLPSTLKAVYNIRLAGSDSATRLLKGLYYVSESGDAWNNLGYYRVVNGNTSSMSPIPLISNVGAPNILISTLVGANPHENTDSNLLMRFGEYGGSSYEFRGLLPGAYTFVCYGKQINNPSPAHFKISLNGTEIGTVSTNNAAADVDPSNGFLLNTHYVTQGVTVGSSTDVVKIETVSPGMQYINAFQIIATAYLSKMNKFGT